jgi:hypothetical protein
MIGGIPDGSGKVPDDRGGYLGIIQRGKDVADMEYITTTEPKLSSRSLAESYKAHLSHLVLELEVTSSSPEKLHRNFGEKTGDHGQRVRFSETEREMGPLRQVEVSSHARGVIPRN